MLVGFGDKGTLDLFEQIQPEEKDPDIKKALISAIDQLEYRLNKVMLEKQTEWANYEILCWGAFEVVNSFVVKSKNKRFELCLPILCL
jgi:hypothetical protein